MNLTLCSLFPQKNKEKTATCGSSPVNQAPLANMPSTQCCAVDFDQQDIISGPSASIRDHPVPDARSACHQSRVEDVAIVGMSCRTAGGVTNPEELWQFLLDKKEASGEIPRQRWETWLRRDSRNVKEIERTISKGYFIHDLEEFDAAMFGISPKEAEQMDPHQRMALELASEALEHAGISAQSLARSNTAVYMGVDSDDFSRLMLEDLPNIDAWMGIGTAPHGIPNRISYHFDLMGPSVAVDAACASSLVAVDMGRQAILNGDSEVALVGGVQVDIAPALFVVSALSYCEILVALVAA